MYNNSYHYLGLILAQKGFTVGAEIGVDRGHFSKYLLKLMPELFLYCVDPWLYYPEYESREKQHDFNVNYHNTLKRLKSLNALVFRMPSMDAVKEYIDEKLDFVYIDGNHNYSFVKEDIEKWTKKVRPGGIVAGDDYDWYDHKVLRNDVKKAVDEYVAKNKKELFIIQKGRSKTWFFIK